MGATIRVNPQWVMESADSPRYAQEPRGKVGKGRDGGAARMTRLMYLRMNPRTHTAVWLGAAGGLRLKTVTQFLSAHRLCGPAGQQPLLLQYALWLNDGHSDAGIERFDPLVAGRDLKARGARCRC